MGLNYSHKRKKKNKLAWISEQKQFDMLARFKAAGGKEEGGRVTTAAVRQCSAVQPVVTAAVGGQLCLPASLNRSFQAPGCLGGPGQTA